MAKKRKLESKSAEPTKTHQLLLQEQEQEQNKNDVEEEQQEEYEDQEGMEEDEEEEEYEEEVEEEEEDNEGSNGAADNNQTGKTLSTASAAASAADQDDAEEPVLKLLEPFSKDQLVNLLREAADKHSDVADRIRKVANEDPAHRKIFVHGLSWDTNAETLTSVFKQYGEIEDCKAVSDKISGKSKGYGFILFKTRSGARKALKQPQKKIGNRMTACQLASIGPVPSPAAVAAPVVPTQPVMEYTQKKIYVSNVSAELDPQKLLTFFSKYGEIEEGPLGLDKQTGKPRGFCLFVYKTTESAKKALEEPHKNFEGHILHCQRAIDGPKPNKQNPHHHHNPHNAQFQRNENPSFIGAAGPGHLMAPSAAAGSPFNHGAATQALNPALGQALTALLATQGAGLGLTNLLGTLGTAGLGAVVNPAVPGAGHGVHGVYGNQVVGSSISPGVMGGYGNQGGYPNQQMGQGGSGRSQHGVGHMGPYMGH